MSVYSERFLLVRDAGSFSYAVPAGKRAIVKQITSYNAGAQTGRVSVSLPLGTFYVRSVPAGDAIEAHGLMVVAYAGEALTILHTDGQLRTALCGYLLGE